MKEECLICQAPLEYLETETLMECACCHRQEMSQTRCINGHYACNECHTKGMDAVIGYCLNGISKNPVEILDHMMNLPFCHMHGPKHHTLVGAALSTGMCMSILSGATPLTQASWGQSNLMTARSLLKIGEVGGPRCSKRNSYLSIQAAASYIQETKGVTLEMKPIVCHRSDSNNQCIGKRCPFHPSHSIPQS